MAAGTKQNNKHGVLDLRECHARFLPLEQRLLPRGWRAEITVKAEAQHQDGDSATIVSKWPRRSRTKRCR
ncbi:hypothetical protein E2C01_086331 [Portunus trituberculatus]|uniref:Uncharacterized protein n=1 Tax=Portunus trituberculatus TaxID=210409 RepID=A0A5B7J9E1_PORTR|nr:hypothetical protein [Portunus trituberculatus]